MIFDNVGVIEVLEQVDFRLHVLEVCHPKVLETDLLDGHRLARAPIEGPVDAAKGAFPEAIPQLEVLEASNILGCSLGGTLSARALLPFAELAILPGRRGC